MDRNGIEIYWRDRDVVFIAGVRELPAKIASCRDTQHERHTRPFCRRHRACWSTPTLNEVICGSELRRRLVASRNARTNHPVPVESPC